MGINQDFIGINQNSIRICLFFFNFPFLSGKMLVMNAE